MTRFSTVVSILIITLVSCGDTGMFLPSLGEDGDIAVQTVADGTVIGPDGSIGITFQVGPQGTNPDRVVVTVSDRGGRAVLSRTVVAGEIDRGRLPAVSVSGLAVGIYTVGIDFFAAGRQLGAQRRTVFISDGVYRIAGVSAYPPSFEPDSIGILRADLDIPAGADPYLRWSFAGRPVSEGLLSSGAGQLRLRSPGTEGVYAVRLELFPTGPGGDGFRFPSTVAQNSDLVVREVRSAAERGYGPASSYYALMHIAGNLRDAGSRPSLLAPPVADARLIGDADLRIVQELFGYHFDGTSGIVIDEVLLPARNGRLEPFSVVMRLVLTEEQSDRVLFATSAEDGTFGLTIILLEEGFLRAQLRGSNRLVQVDTDTAVAPPNRPIDINLAVIPGADRTEVRWFADGAHVGGALVDLSLPPPRTDDPWAALRGTTRIAGEAGFVGLIDEFGVYFRNERNEPSADIEVFRTAGQRRFGESLIMAQGFEAGLGTEIRRIDGDVSSDSGVLRIGPLSAVGLPVLNLLDGPANIQLVATPGGGTAPANQTRLGGFTDPEQPAVFSIGFDGAVVVPGHARQRIDPVVPMHVLLQYHEGTILISDASGTVVPVPFGPGRPELYLSIINESETGIVEIESILVYRDSERITQSFSSR